MTRNSTNARLFGAGILLAFASMIAAGCGSASTNVASVDSQSSASASAAVAATPAKPAASSRPAVAQPETSPYGLGPSPSLPKSCLISVAEAEMLVSATGLTAGPNSTHNACVITGSGSNSPTVTTSVITAFGAAGYPIVQIPQGSPFKVAYAWKSNGFFQAVAELQDQSRWVDISLGNPVMSDQQQLAAVRAGLQNIMYWWSRSATHSPAPGGAQVPDLAACKVLPSSIFSVLLGGAAVTSFDGSIDTLCTLNSANPGVKAEIAYRPVSDQVEQNVKSQEAQVAVNVWELSASTYITFVHGKEVGVDSPGIDFDTHTVIAALEALSQ